MNMTPVKSSNLSAVGYDKSTMTMLYGLILGVYMLITMFLKMFTAD